MVPPEIVKRILKGAFVDMAELLKDNLEKERRRSLVENGAMPPFQARHSRREILDVLSSIASPYMQPWSALSTPTKLRDCWHARHSSLAGPGGVAEDG